MDRYHQLLPIGCEGWPAGVVERRLHVHGCRTGTKDDASLRSEHVVVWMKVRKSPSGGLGPMAQWVSRQAYTYSG